MAGPVIELLQELIRNECVNDGSVESGHEERSVMTLTDFFGREGQVFEPAPGRQSLVYRVEGSDPEAPALALVPHIDVVPADPDGWSFDPFAAEIREGMVYGRGALDMLNITAAMAIAFKPYLTGEKRARGDLVFCAVADEEGGGRFGAGHLVKEHWDLVGSDFMLTELAYPGLPGRDQPVVPVSVGEKGAYFSKLKATGVPGHGSAPYGAENAADVLVDALHGIQHVASPIAIPDHWIDFAANLGFDQTTTEKLVDEELIDSAIDDIAVIDPTMARYLHAATHLTISANFIRAGNKANIVADKATGVLDIRALPGMDRVLIDEHLRTAMGPVAGKIDIQPVGDNEANQSPIDNLFWEAIADSVDSIEGHRNLAPALTPATTDARFWRRRGAVAYGVGLYDSTIGFSELLSLFHGHDERVSVESVIRTTALYEELLSRFNESRPSRPGVRSNP